MIKPQYILNYIIILLLLVLTVEVFEVLGFEQVIDNIEILIISGITYAVGLFQVPPGNKNNDLENE